MAPPQYSPRPLVPSKVSRQRWRFSSVFSTPMDWRRNPHVPLDSSIAKMPLPGIVICFTVARSSSLYSEQWAPAPELTEARMPMLLLRDIIDGPARAPRAALAVSNAAAVTHTSPENE